MTHVVIPVIDFRDIGSSLVFYAKQEAYEHEKGFPVAYVHNIYWKDDKSPQGHGPFHNMYDAMEHHKAAVIAERAEEGTITAIAAPEWRAPLDEATPDNLILVDFKAKKRIN